MDLLSAVHLATPFTNVERMQISFPCQQYVFTRSLRRGSKDAGTSKKGLTEKANGGEKGRVAAVQEEVGQSPTTAKQRPFPLGKCPDLD